MSRKGMIDGEKHKYWIVKYFFEKGPKGFTICMICSYDCTVNQSWNWVHLSESKPDPNPKCL